MRRPSLLLAATLFSQLPAGSLDNATFPLIAGWEQTAPVKRFAPDKLFEYIDGAADGFLVFSFQELQVAEYGRPDKASVVVEAYRHQSPLLAFGIYSQEKPDQGDFPKIGAQGYLAPPILNFVMGDTYYKLSAYGLGDSAGSTLMAFARKLEALGKGSKELPRELDFFPASGKQPNSERFVSENLLGYEYLHSGFTAEYREGDKSFQLLLIKGRDRKDCETMLCKYFVAIRAPEALDQGQTRMSDEGVVRPDSATRQPEIKEGRFKLMDPNHGELSLSWKGSYICAVLRLPDAKSREQHLTQFESRIP